MLAIGSLALSEKRRERARVRVGGQLVAERCSDLHYARPAFGRPDDALYKERSFRLEEGRHRAVGCDHQVLDEPPCAVLLRHGEADHFAIPHDWTGFNGLNFQSTALATQLPKPVRCLFLDRKSTRL